MHRDLEPRSKRCKPTTTTTVCACNMDSLIVASTAVSAPLAKSGASPGEVLGILRPRSLLLDGLLLCCIKCIKGIYLLNIILQLPPGLRGGWCCIHRLDGSLSHCTRPLQALDMQLVNLASMCFASKRARITLLTHCPRKLITRWQYAITGLLPPRASCRLVWTCQTEVDVPQLGR